MPKFKGIGYSERKKDLLEFINIIILFLLSNFISFLVVFYNKDNCRKYYLNIIESSFYIITNKYYIYFIAILIILFNFILKKIYFKKKKAISEKNLKDRMDTLQSSFMKQKKTIRSLKKEISNHKIHIEILKNMRKSKNLIENETYTRIQASEKRILKKFEIIHGDLRGLAMKDPSVSDLLEIASEVRLELEDGGLFLYRDSNLENFLPEILIEDSLNILLESIFLKNIIIKKNINDLNREIFSDKYILSIIIFNLIKCSVDRISNNGELEISTSLSNDKNHFRLQIRDNGYAFDITDLIVYNFKKEDYISPLSLKWAALEKLIRKCGGTVIEKKESLKDGNTVIIEFPFFYDQPCFMNAPFQKAKNVLQFSIQ